MRTLKAICADIAALDNAAQGREFTNEEKTKRDALKREFETTRMQLEADHTPAPVSEQPTLLSQVREALANPGQSRQISLAMQQRTIVSTTAATGGKLVGSQVNQPIEALHQQSILGQLGARIFTGLPMGDQVVPVVSKATVAWAAENGSASDGNPSFGGVTLKPKRVTAYVDISKTLLAQESADAESILRNDLMKSVIDLLQTTLFGNAAGSATQPAGMLYGNTPTVTTTAAGVFGVEAVVEAKGATNCKYLVSAKAKAALRAMAMNNTGRLLMDGGDIAGTPAIVGPVAGATGTEPYIYGDWSRLAVGIWDSADITVDPYTQATKGAVRIVINAYVDAQVADTNAFAFGTTHAATA